MPRDWLDGQTIVSFLVLFCFLRVDKSSKYQATLSDDGSHSDH